MTDVAASTTPAAQGRKLPVWAIAGVVGVLGAVGGGALSTALVKNQAEPEAVVAEAPVQKPVATPVARAGKGQAESKPVVHENAVECRSCGVVEKVVAVKHKGEGTGIGAVGGAVVGGLLGNQVGGGNGKKAMTVVGAVGGGLAGHEIEKQARATTSYKVTVRMDDGTTKTVTQATAPVVGSRIQL